MRVGTWQWMAPEILRDGPNTKETDVWAFGLIVWEILFKKIPFKELGPHQMVNQVGKNEKFVNNYLWTKHKKVCDPFLTEISKMCTAYDPKERPTFAELSKLFDESKKHSGEESF